jgi:hypothetical protein
MLLGRTASHAAAATMAGRSLHDRLADVLRRVIKRDQYEFFGAPVDPVAVPDYADIVTSPMDFGTLQAKLVNREYTTIDAFTEDVRLLCTNAMLYNAPATIYYREAEKIWAYAEKVIAALRAKWDGECKRQTNAAASGSSPGMPLRGT